MNPMALFKLKNMWDQFVENHPKLPLFGRAVMQNGIQEGTIIEINVTTADGQNMVSNFQITASDMELLTEAMELMKDMT